MTDYPKIKPLLSLLLSFLLIGTGNTQQWQADANTTIRVQYKVVPLFIGTKTNACIDIQFFCNKTTDTLRRLELQLNDDAVKALATLELLQPDENSRLPIQNAQVIRSTDRVTPVTQLLLAQPLHQGWNNFTVNVHLRPDADPDSRPFIKIKAIQNNRGVSWKPLSSFKVTAFRTGILLRQKGQDNVHTYRIPGITVTDKGSLVAVYDARYKNSGDLPGNIDVAMSRSTDGGKHWNDMRIIMDMGAPHENNGVGDPAILFDPHQSRLWVAALWSKGNRSIAGSQPGLSPDTTGQFVLVNSGDDGLTWSAPQSITPQVKNPEWHLYFNGPGNGICMKNGTLVFASQYWDETTEPAKVGIPHSSIVYSRDHGQSWASGIGAKNNTTESQVVETTNGTLMLNMRDNRGLYRSVATTSDMGKTWQEHPSSRGALTDPVCMAGFIKAPVYVKGQTREVLFFSNTASSIQRSHTSIRASADYGSSWPAAYQLLVDERSGYGYSSLINIDKQTLGLIYEGTGELYFLRIPVKDIIR